MNQGEVIKDLRIKMGLTQKELAEKLGVEQSTIGMLESNRRKASTELVEKLADFFGVTTDEILGRNVKSNDISPDVRLLLRNAQDGNLTRDQLKVINNIINQFKDANNK